MANTEQALNKAKSALQAAQQFITNGVALGFIRMPDADTPDPARDTPRLIADALSALTAASAEAATPVAWMWQHDETGRIGFVEAFSDDGEKALWQQLNPRLAIVSPLYTSAPQANQPNTLGDMLKESGLDAYIKEDDLAHAMAAANFASMVRRKALEQASQPIGQPEPFGYYFKHSIGGNEMSWSFSTDKPDACGMYIEKIIPLYASNSQPVSGAVMTDAEIDKVQTDAYMQLAASGYNGGMGGLTWDRASARAIEAAVIARLSASGQAVSEKASVTAKSSQIVAKMPDGSTAANVYEAFERGRQSVLQSTPAQQTEAPVNVPSGWKLVPHEPTAEMRNEGADMMWDRKGTSVDVWQAMWHAAPAPVQTEAQQSEKDAERYRWAVKCDDSAEALYSFVMSHAPDIAAINRQVDDAITKEKAKS